MEFRIPEVAATGCSMKFRPLAAPSRAGGWLSRQGPWLLLLIVLLPLTLMPLLQLEARALWDATRSFSAMAQLPRIARTIGTTAYLGVGSMVVAMVAGSILAWSVAHLPPRIRGVASIIPVIPLVIPAVANVTGWAFLFSPTSGYANALLRQLPMFSDLDQGPVDVYSVPWIILITGLSLTSFVYVFVYSGLRNLGSEFEAAAAIAGAGRMRVFLTITLPLLRPSIVYASGIALLLGLGQFTAPLLLGRTRGIDVLTTEMFHVVGRYPIDYGLGAALGTPILAVGLLVVWLQYKALKHEHRFVTRGARATLVTADTSLWPLLPIGFYGLFSAVLPLLALTYVSLSPFWTSKITFDRLTLDHFRTVLVENPFTRDAIVTSVVTSFLAVAIVLPIGFVAALALLNHTRVSPWLRRAIDILVMLPLGVPAAVFGFGMLFAYTQWPFRLYGTTAMLVVAYVTVMIPHATRMQLATLMSLTPDYWAASRAAGAGPMRTLVRIILPLARPGIGGAMAIMLVMLFHEFAVSLMVRSAQTQVMGTVLYDFWSSGTYGEVAAMALLMVVVTTLGVALAMWIAGRDVLERL